MLSGLTAKLHISAICVASEEVVVATASRI